ncbi:CsgE family curli-type amyloid fiber assembly protein [Litoribrevibacter euphylliae]|uniref:Curli production assembly/transport component CsgE n=1 Tax=Litoribrevibacter euphylliae TaxID=1834034 RepID=A0ABV7HF57_9GAMM
MKHPLPLILFISFLFVWGQVQADNPDKDLSTGLTIDHTVSRFGHDFYRYLADHRRTYFSDATENLIIRERPSARWGSIIWVESYGNQVYYNRIGAGGTDIKSLAESASIQINKRLQKLKVERMFNKSVDLAEDEIQL